MKISICDCVLFGWIPGFEGKVYNNMQLIIIYRSLST